MRKEFKKPLINLLLLNRDEVLTSSQGGDMGHFGKGLNGVIDNDEEIVNGKWWF